MERYHQNVRISLPNLEQFLGGENKFTKNIPISLSNTSRLRMLDFFWKCPHWTLSGKHIGSLWSLVVLNFGRNGLGSGKVGDLDFLSFLANCSSLEELGLDNNHFGGELTESITNLSTQLKILSLSNNSLHGNIPIGIGNLVNLTVFAIENNYFGGIVPPVIGRLHKLRGTSIKLLQILWANPVIPR